MRKLLLGTTALVAAAAFSGQATAADKIKLSVGGYGNFAAAYVDQDETAGTSLRDHGFSQETEVHFKGKTVLDNGLEVGFRAELELDRDQRNDTGSADDIIDEVYMHISGGFGEIQLGSQDGVADQMGVFAPRIADGNRLDDPEIYFFQTPGTTGSDSSDGYAPTILRTDVSSSDDFLKIIYFTPRLAGFQLGVSYMPEPTKGYTGYADRTDIGETEQSEIFEIGINFDEDFGGVGVSAYAAYLTGSSEIATTDDLEDWGAGANVGFDIGFGELTIGGSYRNVNARGSTVATLTNDAETTIWAAGVLWENGPWSLAGQYLNAEEDATTTDNEEGTGYQIEGGWMAGPGIQFTLGYQHREFEAEDGSLPTYATAEAEADIIFLETGLKF
ncbi:MAG: porin [Alphaproteobacteria bacterium]|nr:porin [Alphaproteobacteria bacterium]